MAETDGGLDIAGLARRIGRYRWAEITLFEALGGWVATVPEVDVKVCLAAHSAHHAWHAELWAERLPDVPVVADTPALPGVGAALVEPSAAELTIEKLVGAHRVLLPRLASAYAGHLARISAATDAPTVRVLQLALRDVLDDWREGELLLQSLIRMPQDAARAAARQGQLEALLVAAGGITAG